MYGTASALYYVNIRLLLLYINETVPFNMHFQKQQAYYHYQQTICTVLKDCYRVCVPVLNTMEKCSDSDESGLFPLAIWFSGGLVSVRPEVGLDDIEVSSNLDNYVIL